MDLPPRARAIPKTLPSRVRSDEDISTKRRRRTAQCRWLWYLWLFYFSLFVIIESFGYCCVHVFLRHATTLDGDRAYTRHPTRQERQADAISVSSGDDETETSRNPGFHHAKSETFSLDLEDVGEGYRDAHDVAPPQKSSSSRDVTSLFIEYVCNILTYVCAMCNNCLCGVFIF